MKRLIVNNNIDKISPIIPIYPMNYLKPKEDLIDKKKKNIKNNEISFEDILNEELRRN